MDDEVRQKVLDAAALLPDGGVVGGWAAAYLHGAHHLDGRDQPVLLLVPPRCQIDRPGIATVRTDLELSDVVTRHGVRCSSGDRTGFDVVRLAPDLTGAVVAGDSVLRAGLSSRVKLRAYATAHPGRRGLRRLRQALPLLDAAAASPPESRLRMLCRFGAGLPPLRVNTPVYDAQDELLGVPDLLEPECGLVVEYDGEYHRELRQHTADNLREERFESAGLTVVRVTSLDLKHGRATADRIAAAHHRAHAHTHTPTTRAWSVRPRELVA